MNLRKLNEFRKMRKHCNHFVQRAIYGDEINAVGGYRAECQICFRLLTELPPKKALMTYQGEKE
jgi:hypothetical protein